MLLLYIYNSFATVFSIGTRRARKNILEIADVLKPVTFPSTKSYLNLHCIKTIQILAIIFEWFIALWMALLYEKQEKPVALSLCE